MLAGVKCDVLQIDAEIIIIIILMIILISMSSVGPPDKRKSWPDFVLYYVSVQIASRAAHRRPASRFVFNLTPCRHSPEPACLHGFFTASAGQKAARNPVVGAGWTLAIA